MSAGVQSHVLRRDAHAAAVRFEHGLQLRHVGADGAAVPSLPLVAMTVSMLRDAGVEVDDSTANRWYVAPGPIAARDWIIEPDLSNAAPFLEAAMSQLANLPWVEGCARTSPAPV